MDLGPHAAFIVIAYGFTTLVVGAMIVWIAVDYRRQLRSLADLEARGVTRRSERAATFSGPSLPAGSEPKISPP
jgi:heme exporter protein D